MKTDSFFSFFFSSIAALLIVSCTSGRIEDFKTSLEDAENQVKPDTLKLCFAGDIMAHKPNFDMTDYSIIWDDIRAITGSSDFSFANLETTIDDINPAQTYPKFCVHSSYADEAVKAGFNVFSLANNHINDYELSGINSTQSWANKVSNDSKNSTRTVYFSGLHKKAEPFSYSYIEKNGWKILFIAVTELLNQYTYTSYINFVPPSTKGRAEFMESLKKLRSEHECDIFILSLHTAETEYELATTTKQNQYYLDLLNKADVDIIWANHPHVVKPWSRIYSSKSDKLLMRANGNTISGQRWQPDFSNPSDIKEYTGDSVLLNVVLEKTPADTAYDLQTKKHVQIKSIEPIFITTYIDSSWNFIIKRLNHSFISELEKEGRSDWAKYLKERKKIMKNTKENIIWQ